VPVSATVSHDRGMDLRDPYARDWRTRRQPEGLVPLVMPLVGPVGRKNRARLAPLRGMERPRRKVRFARLIQRRDRVLGGPLARAASGGI
jgi:hypothetical protein